MQSAISVPAKDFHQASGARQQLERDYNEIVEFAVALDLQSHCHQFMDT